MTTVSLKLLYISMYCSHKLNTLHSRIVLEILAMSFKYSYKEMMPYFTEDSTQFIEFNTTIRSF